MRYGATWIALVAWVILAGVTLGCASATAAPQPARIDGDIGGQIGPYIRKLQEWRDTGRRVIVDGPCFSACTLMLGIIPRKRICITSRAQFGFHAAWKPGPDGVPVMDADATQFLMTFYPNEILKWIAVQGGLSSNIKLLEGPELAAMYAPCRSGAR